jgi:hypothetical protein
VRSIVFSLSIEGNGPTNKPTNKNKMHAYKFTNKSTGRVITINAQSFNVAYIDFLWAISNPSECTWPDDYTMTSDEF